MNLILLPRRGFYDEDLLNLVEIIDKYYVATVNKEISIGKKGTKVIPDFSIQELIYFQTNPFENLFIIADEGWKDLYNQETKIIISSFLVPPKKIIAISLAPILLFKLGFLNGRIITYNFEEFPEYEKELIGKVKLTNFPIFKDGNIITCKGRENIFLIKNYL